MPAPRVAVVGGGIAGLAAARAVRAARPDAHLTLLDKDDEVGGKLRTTPLGGRPVEEGADAFLVRVPDAVALARAVGVADDLVHPAVGTAALWTGGRLRSLPPGTVLGVPADLAALARSEVLSPAGLLRAASDVLRPGEPQVEDTTVGAYVRRRLGAEVVDRLVDPLLGGVYAGRADALGLHAALPQLRAAVARHRSLVLAARASRQAGPADGPVFATLPAGTGALAAAVLAAAGVDDLRRRTTVTGLARTATGWRLTTGPRPSPAVLDVDAVVLAVPAPAAARLLDAVAPGAAAELRAVAYASVAVAQVVLRVREGALPALSGWLVPPVDGRLTKAVTLSGRKWAHLDLGDGLVVARASVGRAGEEADLQRDDDELIAAVVADLQAATGTRVEVVQRRVSRWGGALPQYGVGHLDLVRRAEQAVAAHPGLALAGAAYRGVGIPACVRSGEQAAARVVAALPDGGQSAA